MLFISPSFIDMQWSLVTGAWVGVLYVFVFFFGYIYQNPSAVPINVGIVGVILNCVVCVITEMVFFRRDKLRLRNLFSTEYTDSADERGGNPLVGRPDWDLPCTARFGEKPLTASLLNLMMKGFPERELMYYVYSTRASTLQFLFVCS